MPERLFEPDFLLGSPAARRLYHEHAEPQPIVDFHCHLEPALVAKDHRFSSITEVWLRGDHYKWRAMRANGIPERLCTGDATDWEKFEAWSRTVPRLLRNPLYHWTHLELKNPFGICELLDEGSAARIYERTGELLSGAGFSTQRLLERFGVEVVCTTDDPVDALEHHVQFAASPCAARVSLLPTWRPDAALGVEARDTFCSWVRKLEASCGRSVQTYDALLEALDERHAFFHSRGCRVADHGLEALPALEYTLSGVRDTFVRVTRGEPVSPLATREYQSALLYELAVLNHSRGWCQQYHLGALRNVNTGLTESLGADAGVDTIGDAEMARPLGRFLDRLSREGRLGKTILYNLNPRDNEVFATMVGSFQDGSIPGKLQYGAAWWFLDQLDGMRKQLDALSNHGLLSRFVGMVTDSRSFLSYSRHEYFRRLLCNLVGSEMERGLLPGDMALVGGMVEDICYRNARNFFGFPLPATRI